MKAEVSRKNFREKFENEVIEDFRIKNYTAMRNSSNDPWIKINETVLKKYINNIFDFADGVYKEAKEENDRIYENYENFLENLVGHYLQDPEIDFGYWCETCETGHAEGEKHLDQQSKRLLKIIDEKIGEFAKQKQSIEQMYIELKASWDGLIKDKNRENVLSNGIFKIGILSGKIRAYQELRCYINTFFREHE